MPPPSLIKNQGCHLAFLKQFARNQIILAIWLFYQAYFGKKAYNILFIFQILFDILSKIFFENLTFWLFSPFENLAFLKLLMAKFGLFHFFRTFELATNLNRNSIDKYERS
jgi:hypothetical protein